MQRFYSNVGRDKELLNPRIRFDKANIREVMVDQGGMCNAFIEAIFISNNKDMLINLALRGKYKTKETLIHMFELLLNKPELSKINQFYTFIHIGDSQLEFLLDLIGFRRVVDRPTLSKIQAKLDGYHLTYLFERKRTVTNRSIQSHMRMPAPRLQPIRTGDIKEEGEFDALARLKNLKEKDI